MLAHLAVLSATLVAPPPASAHLSLSKWFKEMGGQSSDALTLGDSPMGIGKGFCVNRDVEAGEGLMLVPGKACLSAAVASSDPEIGDTVTECLNANETRCYAPHHRMTAGSTTVRWNQTRWATTGIRPRGSQRNRSVSWLTTCVFVTA